jgi:hypothetical protein
VLVLGAVAAALVSTTVHGGVALAATTPPEATIVSDDTTGVQDVSLDVPVSASECAAIQASYGTTDCTVSVGLRVEPVGGIQIGVESGGALASPYRLYHERAVTCMGHHVRFGGPSGLFCDLAYIEIDATYKHWYNASRTWISSMIKPCPRHADTFFTVTQTWCSWTGNGTAQMVTGMNFNWSDPTESGNGWARITNHPIGGWTVRQTLTGT